MSPVVVCSREESVSFRGYKFQKGKPSDQKEIAIGLNGRVDSGERGNWGLLR